jgi:hypothetical protein
LKKISEKRVTQDWLSFQDKLDKVEKNGSLLHKRIFVRYSDLLKRYDLPPDESNIPVTSSIYNEELLSKQEKLFKCFEVYRYLYLNNFRFIASRSPGILIETIETLRVALKSNNITAAETAVAKARELLQPTRIVNIPQLKNGATFSKHIDIVGIAQHFTEFELLVENKTQKWKRSIFQVNADGSFKLTKIPLVRGKNRIEIRPVRIPELLQNGKFFLAFVINRTTVPFLRGLWDPITKDMLEEAELEDIIRCIKCQTYWLRVSWQYDGRCPKCGSYEYCKYDHPNFELLEQ